MSVNDRIELLITSLRLNVNSFSREIGFASNGTVANIVGGKRNSPSFQTIERIVRRFPMVNIEWLIKGSGNMFLQHISADDQVNEPTPSYSKGDKFDQLLELLGISVLENDIQEIKRDLHDLKERMNEVG